MPTPVLFPKPKVVRDVEKIREESQPAPSPAPPSSPSGKVGKHPPSSSPPQKEPAGTGVRTPERISPFTQTPGTLVLKKPEPASGQRIQGIPAEVVKRTSPPKPTTSYESIKSDISGKLSSLQQMQLNIFFAPPGAKFYDASGKEYTKAEAMGLIAEQRHSIKETKAKVEAYEEFGYHVKEGETPGSLMFYRTPEEVRESVIQSKMSELDKLYREDKLAGVGHVISTGLLSWEDPFSVRSGLAYVTGGQEGFLRVKAESSVGLDASMKDPLSFTVTLFTSPIASLGTSFGIGAGANIAEKTIAGASQYAKLSAGKGAFLSLKRVAPELWKIGLYTTGLAVGGMMIKDVWESYERDPLLGIAKGVSYAGMFASAMKGYELAGGAEAVSTAKAKGAERFYTEHPERIKIYTGELGEQGASMNLGGDKAKIFVSRGTPRETITVRKGKLIEWTPGEDWAGTRQPGQGSIEIKGLSGTKVKGGELLTTEGSVKTRPLTEELRYADILSRSGEIETTMGKRIYDVKMTELRHLKELSSKELGGSGGIAKLDTVQLAQELNFLSQGSSAPIFYNIPGVRSGIAPVLLPPTVKGVTGVIHEPVFRGELQEPDWDFKDIPVFTVKPKTRQEPGFAEFPIFDTVQDIGQDSASMKAVVYDVALKTEYDFDFIPDLPGERPIFEDAGKSAPPGFPRFGVSLGGQLVAGGDDWIDVFGRTRRFTPGSLEKAFKVGKL